VNTTPKASLEERVAKIEGILEQMDKRLNHIETEISGLRNDTSTEMSSLRAEISNLRTDMERRFESLFKWTVGLILGMWITIIMTLIPILLKILGII